MKINNDTSFPILPDQKISY